jgi:hypothetical protein
MLQAPCVPRSLNGEWERRRDEQFSGENGHCCANPKLAILAQFQRSLMLGLPPDRQRNEKGIAVLCGQFRPKEQTTR